MEFSKKLIVGASFFYGLLAAISLLSWFFTGDWPQEIIKYFAWPPAAIVLGYCGKSAYENKEKIKKGD